MQGTEHRAARFLVWNVQWATNARQDNARGNAVATVLAAPGVDVICVTEGRESLLPAGGHVIDSEPDYGYKLNEGRRKVLLWSQEPWRDIDRDGHPALPPGRFAAATTSTSLVPVRVIGVCIPWSFAHVSTGHKNRQRWQDHLAYINALAIVLDQHEPERALVLCGDFNQTIPRTLAPKRAHEALLNALAPLHVATRGEIPGLERPLIDHCAHAPTLSTQHVQGLSRTTSTGLPLSDHDGVIVELTR